MQEKECTYTTAQVGRYLMNKMSPEEETLFQEHLISCPACWKDLFEICRQDKKSTTKGIHAILLHNIGDSYIQDFSFEKFETFIQGGDRK